MKKGGLGDYYASRRQEAAPHGLREKREGTRAAREKDGREEHGPDSKDADVPHTGGDAADNDDGKYDDVHDNASLTSAKDTQRGNDCTRVIPHINVIANDQASLHTAAVSLAAAADIRKNLCGTLLVASVSENMLFCRDVNAAQTAGQKIRDGLAFVRRTANTGKEPANVVADIARTAILVRRGEMPGGNGGRKNVALREDAYLPRRAARQ